jgi:hypothetical protein
MRLKAAKIIFGAWALTLSFLMPNLSRTQVAAMLSGTVTGPAGRVVSSVPLRDPVDCGRSETTLGSSK